MSPNPCPFCGSEMTDLVDDEEADDILYRHYDCECGLSFVEAFEYSHTEDEDGNRVEGVE